MPESPLDNPEVYRAVLEDLHTGVYFVDRDRRIVFWNRGAEQISGFLSQEVIGRSCRDEILVHCDANNITLCGDHCPLLETMRNGRPSSAEVFLRHKSGQRIPVNIRALPIKDSKGIIVGAAEYFEEPRVSGFCERRCSDTANRLDEVTGLPSDGASEKALEQHLLLFKEHHLAFSVFRVHVDRLGHFTANHGKDAGGQLRRVVAQTLRNALRPEDFVGSWAENEFLIILKVHRHKALARVAERLRAIASCAAIEWWGDRLSITLSFGIYSVQAGDDMETLMEKAERALDRSIDEGGNRFTFCLPGDHSSPGADSCS